MNWVKCAAMYLFYTRTVVLAGAMRERTLHPSGLVGYENYRKESHTFLCGL